MLHLAPPWSGYLEVGATGDISTVALPSARPLRQRRPYQPDLLLLLRLSLARSRCCGCSGSRLLALLLLLRLSLDRSLAQLLLLLSPSLVLLLCSD